MDEVIRKVSDMPSDKKGYIYGVKYYYDIIMRTPGLSQERVIYRVLTDFGMELEDLIKYEDSTSVINLSEIFKRLYPDGEVHELFESNVLQTALDGISECLYRLKKEYHLERWN